MSIPAPVVTLSGRIRTWRNGWRNSSPLDRSAAARAMADPADWRAQERLVEIMAGQLGDPEREAEERNRLLKHPDIPEAAWAQAALDQGRLWERQGNPERAVNSYKSLLWRVAEGPDAEEAKRRLKELERPSAPATGEVGGFGP